MLKYIRWYFKQFMEEQNWNISLFCCKCLMSVYRFFHSKLSEHFSWIWIKTFPKNGWILKYWVKWWRKNNKKKGREMILREMRFGWGEHWWTQLQWGSYKAMWLQHPTGNKFRLAYQTNTQWNFFRKKAGDHEGHFVKAMETIDQKYKYQWKDLGNMKKK